MSSNRSLAAVAARERGGLSARAEANATAPSALQLALRTLIGEPGRYFPEATEKPRIASMTVQRRRLSEIARVDLALGTSMASVYVKVHQHPTSPPSRVHRKARLEFDTLGHLYEQFHSVPGCAVVRPIAFFPEYVAVVTEAAAGENLHRLLKREVAAWRGRADQAAASEHCRRAGVWLRHFQEITDQGAQEPLPFGPLLESIEADVALCVRLGLPAGAGTQLVDRARACRAALGARPFAVVGQHSDFQPDNVLLTPTAITVLDFTSFQHGAPFSDVARFVATLEFLGKSPLYPRRRLRALVAAFLHGYAGEAAAVKPAMILFLVHHMVRTARMVGSWPHSPLVKRLVERQTMRFLAGWWDELSRGGGAFLAGIGAQHPSRRSEPTARRETTL